MTETRLLVEIEQADQAVWDAFSADGIIVFTGVAISHLEGSRNGDSVREDHRHCLPRPVGDGAWDRHVLFAERFCFMVAAMTSKKLQRREYLMSSWASHSFVLFSRR
jgi:hypothetical protein